MKLTVEDRAVMTVRLKQAEQAYHDLMIGGAPKVFVDQNGERIEYQQGSAQRLASYIEALKIKLGLNAVGPLNVWF